MSDWMTAVSPWIAEEAADAILQSSQGREDAFQQLLLTAADVDLGSSDSRKNNHHDDSDNSNINNNTVRFLQVLQQQSNSRFVLSDCKTRIACTATATMTSALGDGPGDDSRSSHATTVPLQLDNLKGSVVKVEKYRFVWRNRKHKASDDNSSENDASIGIELEAESIQFTGAQGMGIIGDPMEVNETLVVRRALEHIRELQVELSKRTFQNSNHHNSKTASTSNCADTDTRSPSAPTIAPSEDTVPSRRIPKRGDPFALLNKKDIIDRLMQDQEDPNNDDDEIHDKADTQEILFMTQDEQAPIPVNNAGSDQCRLSRGNATTLLQHHDKTTKLVNSSDHDGMMDKRKSQVENDDRRMTDVASNAEYEVQLNDFSETNPHPATVSSPKRRRIGRLLSFEPQALSSRVMEMKGKDDSIPIPKRMKVAPSAASAASSSSSEQSSSESQQEICNDDCSALSEPVGITEMLESSLAPQGTELSDTSEAFRETENDTSKPMSSTATPGPPAAAEAASSHWSTSATTTMTNSGKNAMAPRIGRRRSNLTPATGGSTTTPPLQQQLGSFDSEDFFMQRWRVVRDFYATLRDPQQQPELVTQFLS